MAEGKEVHVAGDAQVPTVLTPAICKSLSDGKIVVSDVGATIPGITGDKLPQFLYELV